MTAPDRDAVIEEVAWLLDGGEFPATIATRLGYQPGSLRKALHRWGRDDLAQRIPGVRTSGDSDARIEAAPAVRQHRRGPDHPPEQAGRRL